MKITIVTGPFLPPPPDGFGAVEVLWHELAKEFVARGHEVNFVTRSWPGRPDEETIDGIRFIRRSGFTRTNRLKWDLIKDMLYTGRVFFTVPAADIVVTNVVWLPIVLARFRSGAGKVVVNVQRAPKRQMGMYRRAARLACTSSAVLEQLAEQSADVVPLAKVLPNPINTRAFVPPMPPRQWDGKRYLTYTGRVHPEKGIHVLIEAFGRLPDRPRDLTLKIVGPTESSRGGGGETYLADLTAKAKGLPVEFIPPIADRNELAKLLQGSHYYCYPSLAEKGESFGVAPLEAMATGLAPVVSDLACFRDFLETGVNGVVFDHRNDAVGNLTRALSSVMDDPQRTIDMGSVAAKTAMKFSNSAVAELYLADFQSLLNGKADVR